jgi:hypothetical protein
MAVPISTRRWIAWPSRLALLLGIGALSMTGADAATSAQGEHPQGGTGRLGELRVWSENGRIYVAEAGAAARELQLGDTAEARRLRALLQQDGGTKGGVRLDRMILAGGGGSGFDWMPPGQAAHPARRTGMPAPSSTPRRPGDGARPVHPASATTPKDRSADKD